MGKETRRRRKKVMGVALPDLGPVLLPPGFCCLPVICSETSCLGPQNRRPVRSSRHVPIERKHSSDARGLDVLLID
jgi:hypothetical protein